MGLTEREKQTLRLLLAGHDAKSIASELGISVHTVNERLRDARRKLGVSSSREAARRLASIEAKDPQSFADKDLGVAPIATARQHDPHPGRGRGAGQPLAWLGGGMIVMSLFVAAIAMSSLIHAGNSPAQSADPGLVPIAASSGAHPSIAVSAAQSWLVLVDNGRWADGWNAAAALFRSQASQAQMASAIQGARGPLGAVSSRTLLTETKTNTLPGLPVGAYEVVQFKTRFAKADALETVVLAHEGSLWKVVGYFIR